ncbi:MAG: glycine cleavage system protein GcvH [Alphaproteobacteria bacterium]|nr:glycine cleavage system protein GcvH [Alphaproteobacteria bacterium]
MADRRYTKDHEWIEINGTVGTVGITNYAQEQLGDVVFVELPAAGKKLTKGGEAAVVESVKAASEVYSPVSGEVVESNAELAKNPAMVNTAAETTGWFVKVKVADAKEVTGLMDAAAYKKFVDGLH